MISPSLRQHLRSSQNIVVFTGAGLSAESGIPGFRDHLGEHGPQTMMTQAAFAADPQSVWGWHVQLAETIRQTKTNAGHAAIARMQDFESRITVVTLNIDQLHQATGSRNIAAMHGSLARLKGFDDPAALQPNATGFTVCKFCGGLTRAENCKPDFDPTHVAPIRLVAGRVPHCPACDLLLRPAIVWYDEPLDAKFERFAYMAATTCDALICVGLSQDARPELWIPKLAIDEGIPVIEIDIERTEISGYADVFLQGSLATILQQVVGDVWETQYPQ
jgi:NAD-dependent deacetylase